VSYIAEYVKLLRDQVEVQNDAIKGTLAHVLKNNRFSGQSTIRLRHQFSIDFHRLTQQPVDSPVTVTKAKLVLVAPIGQTAASEKISINGNSQNGFTKDHVLGDLFATDLGNLFDAGIIKEHTIVVADGGDLTPAVGPAAALSIEKLENMIFYIEYKLG
jgi:hypothetical protein